MSHSPGPWKADKNDAEPFYRVVDATGDLVARVRAQWTNGDVNALLIAAAPNMLALIRKWANGDCGRNRGSDGKRPSEPYHDDVCFSCACETIVNAIDHPGEP